MTTTSTEFRKMTVAELREALRDHVPPSAMPTRKDELLALAELHLAAQGESTEDRERAGNRESADADERAESRESTETDERADTRESTEAAERAVTRESTEASERAELVHEQETERVMTAWRDAGSPEPVSTLPELGRWQMMEHMATRLARSTLMPDRFRNKPDDIIVLLLEAHDLGLTTSMVLSEVVVINGRPTKSAYLMRFLVRRDGHRLWADVEYDANGHAVAGVARGVRRDDPTFTYESRFTIDEAIAAGLCWRDVDTDELRARSDRGNPQPWELWTGDMLVARASSRLCRRAFEDSIGGAAYTPEELGFIDSEGAEVTPTGGPIAPTPLDQVTKDQFTRRLDRLSPELREEVKELWKRRRIPPIDRLTTAHYGAIDAIIEGREKKMPEDAQVVDNPVDTAVDEQPELPPCEDDDDGPDRPADTQDLADVCIECGHVLTEHTADCSMRPM